MATEFGKSSRVKLEMPPPIPFPEKGMPEEEVLKRLKEKLSENAPTEKNFGLSYAGPPHPLAKKVVDMALNTTTVTWAKPVFYGTYMMEKEAVRMVGSLLGAPNAVGFITSGGTESNLLAMRIARNLAKKRKPEIIMPATGHFSFNLAGELFGIKVKRVGWNEDRSPRMDEVEAAINDNTIALVCSAPEGELGLMDPIEEFSKIAEENELYLHVDAAFGGFALPFMREMGYEVPPFDFNLPGVSSMTADGHKLGLLPLTTSFSLFRDESFLEGIPVEESHIWTITSTKNGGFAASAWALFQHLGKEGYKETIRKILEVTQFLSEGISRIEGLRLLAKPFLTVIGFTADDYDIKIVYDELRRKGWGCFFGKDALNQEDYIRLSLHPFRDMEHARGFLEALEDSVKVAKSSH